jgi:hypothetical protein
MFIRHAIKYYGISDIAVWRLQRRRDKQCRGGKGEAGSFERTLHIHIQRASNVRAPLALSAGIIYSEGYCMGGGGGARDF